MGVPPQLLKVPWHIIDPQLELLGLVLPFLGDKDNQVPLVSHQALTGLFP